MTVRRAQNLTKSSSYFQKGCGRTGKVKGGSRIKPSRAPAKAVVARFKRIKDVITWFASSQLAVDTSFAGDVLHLMDQYFNREIRYTGGPAGIMGKVQSYVQCKFLYQCFDEP
ncbi:hypothetical protein FRC12_017817 [Ceratobasidium sp. 428]|nr:hypothetical protein FRC12_017817 [Ceratobasidium sp. 428]